MSSESLRAEDYEDVAAGQPWLFDVSSPLVSMDEAEQRFPVAAGVSVLGSIRTAEHEYFVLGLHDVDGRDVMIPTVPQSDHKGVRLLHPSRDKAVVARVEEFGKLKRNPDVVRDHLKVIGDHAFSFHGIFDKDGSLLSVEILGLEDLNVEGGHAA